MAIRKDWSLTDRLLRGSGDRVNPSGRSAVGPRLSPAYMQEAQRNRLSGGRGGRNPAAQASQRMDPTTFGEKYSNLTELMKGTVGAAKPKPRPSPARIAERSQMGSGFGNRAMPRGAYDPMTYGKPDVASLGDPVSGHTTKHKAQEIQPSPEWRGGRGDFGNPNIPTRIMAAGGPRPDSASGKHRRQASTEAAFRAADASMFDSTVTPKAAPLKDYKPRGRTVQSKSTGTNIQAFY